MPEGAAALSNLQQCWELELGARNRAHAQILVRAVASTLLFILGLASGSAKLDLEAPGRSQQATKSISLTWISTGDNFGLSATVLKSSSSFPDSSGLLITEPTISNSMNSGGFVGVMVGDLVDG